MSTTRDTQPAESPQHTGSEAAATYDALPYPSQAHAFSRPDRLAVAAVLHGMTPPDVSRARILEIGCSDGGNLLPMAYHLPQATCIGINVSPKQIETSRQHAAALALNNVTLEVEDILDFEDATPFDYIIAHGVMSWIPPNIQARLLQTIRQHLAPQGVAYVSYNVYPGCHRNQMMRDMMQYHTRHISDPETRARQALEFVGFLAEAAAHGGSEEANRLRGFHGHIAAQPDWPTFLFHEYLEAYNQPMTLQTFVERCRGTGLQYIADADPGPFDVDKLPADIAAQVRAWSADRVEVEQYMDFVRNTAFRRTLLCRDDVVLQPEWDSEAVATLYMSSQCRPVDAPDDPSGPWDRFQTPAGDLYTPPSRAMARILLHLSKTWPACCSYQELAAEMAEPGLADLVMTLWRAGTLDLHSRPAPCTNALDQRPTVSRLARWEARRGHKVTNTFHHPVTLDDPVARFLLPLLDGSRDVRNLAGVLEAALHDGALKMDYHGKPLQEQGDLAEILPSFVQFHLRKMLDLALLVKSG